MLVVPGIVTILASMFSYLAGKRKNAAEVEHLKAQKKASEAEAAAVIAQAAAEIVGPLIERLRSLQQEVEHLTQVNRQLKSRIEELETLVKDFLPKEEKNVD